MPIELQGSWQVCVDLNVMFIRECIQPCNWFQLVLKIV